MVAAGIRQVIIGGMVGKLVKMAQGETITHAGRNPVNMELVAELAARAGAPPALCEEIRAAETARFALERLTRIGLEREFLENLGRRVIATLSQRYPGKFRLRVLICDFEGNKMAEVDDG